MQAKHIVLAILAIVLFGAAFYLLTNSGNEVSTTNQDSSDTTGANNQIPVEPDNGTGDGAGPIPEAEESVDDENVSQHDEETTTIGASVEGSEITAYHFGSGAEEILLVGGIHGSYSKNTGDLADELVAYYKENESDIPDNITLTIIPRMNPDGEAVGGTDGRFNASGVDLNRNFACDWAPTSMWRDQVVSGGTEAFSEPEAATLRDYVQRYEPSTAIVWFSSEGKVYPSACEDAPDKDSITLAATFASASDYPAQAEFDAYTINGDMVNWMAGEGVIAISVLLSDHQKTEFEKNLAGVQAVLNSAAE